SERHDAPCELPLPPRPAEVGFAAWLDLTQHTVLPSGLTRGSGDTRAMFGCGHWPSGRARGQRGGFGEAMGLYGVPLTRLELRPIHPLPERERKGGVAVRAIALGRQCP